MNYIKMKAQIARIPVQNKFCTKCKNSILHKLKEIQDISNVRLYEKESLVVFNFFRANELSNVLNALTEIGYPEVGERLNDSYRMELKLCQC